MSSVGPVTLGIRRLGGREERRLRDRGPNADVGATPAPSQTPIIRAATASGGSDVI